MCMLKMFGAWLRVDASATYRKLVKALTAAGNRTIAEAVCSARGTKVTLLDVCVCILECTLCCGDERRK